MKKVISITLGSVVFAVEEDAYASLAAYLEAIKQQLSTTTDASEVLDDIERAMAEKFLAKKRSDKRAVTPADVEAVIAELGSPADFGEAAAEGESAGAGTASTPGTVDAPGAQPKKRLYRDTDDAILAGVASGLARYFAIDPVIVRLMFVLLAFFNGLGILAYLILWIVVPEAVTTSEKYAMRGERVTLKDISERVRSNLDRIDQADIETAKGAWGTLRTVLDQIFKFLGAVMGYLLIAARYVVGLLLVIGGALGLAAMVSVYSVLLFSDKVFFPGEVQVALEALQGSALGIVAMTSSFVMMAIPLIVLLIAGASLLAKRNLFTVQKAVTLAVVWIVAAAIAGTTSALQVEQVMRQLGPIEGRFDADSFEMRWENGVMYGDHDSMYFRHEGMEGRILETN